jgi:hypothetical protein
MRRVRSKALRKLSVLLAKEPSKLMVNHITREYFYPKLSQRHIYQQLKKKGLGLLIK